MDFTQPVFLLALLQIVFIDLVLSGDNAIVIALACRDLPPRQQRIGVLVGAGLAVGLRVLSAAFIVYLLDAPYLKAAGGILLCWIGFKLLTKKHRTEEVDAAGNLVQAIRIIVLADAVMSLDNIFAVAAVSKGNVVLLGLGLLISIPLVIFGATLLLRVIGRIPFLVPGGAALIGYLAAEIFLHDPMWSGWIEANAALANNALPLLAAVGVVVAGRLFGSAPPVSIARDALAGATLLGVRALFRTAIARSSWILAAIASIAGYSWGELRFEHFETLRGMDSAIEGLKPLFAAIIAIGFGERLALWVKELVPRGAIVSLDLRQWSPSGAAIGSPHVDHRSIGERSMNETTRFSLASPATNSTELSQPGPLEVGLQRSLLFLLRLSMAWVFLYAGVRQLLNPEWSAGRFLGTAKTFKGMYAFFASPEALPYVDFLVQWGHTLIGTALVLGICVRLAGSFGALLMMMYYFPRLDFPMVGPQNFIVEYHLVYALLLVYLVAARAGDIVGIHGWATRLPIVAGILERFPKLRPWLV